MNVKRLVLGSLLLGLLGGCATYDDGSGHRYYSDNRYGSYDGYRYRYDDGWRRYDGDRGYYRYRVPDYGGGFSYRSQP